MPRQYTSVAKKSVNPLRPLFREIELQPGEHVILRVKKLDGSHRGYFTIEKEYIFLKRYPNFYLFKDLMGFHECFLPVELQHVMKERMVMP